LPMNTKKRLLAAVMLTVAAAYAAPIYTNGAPDTNSGNEATGKLQAEDFTLASTTTLTGARFWAFYWDDPLAGFLGSVDWAIYSNGSSQPGSSLFSGTATPNIGAGAPSCCTDPITVMFDFALPNIQLTAGTYWLVLHNGPVSSATTDQEFFWQTTAANSTATGREQAAPFGGSNWLDTGLEHAFELDGFGSASAEGEVPEPATLGLTGMALLGLAWCRRKTAR
jgi:hypothetical protein